MLCASSLFAANSATPTSSHSVPNQPTRVTAVLTKAIRLNAATAAATAPTLTMSPSSIAFGTVNVNAQASRTVTITNPAVSTGTQTVTFDNPVPSSSKDSALSGTYQGINFGSTGWFWGGAYGADASNSIYFATSSATSASFSFASPQLFHGLKIATTKAGTLTLSDNQAQTKTASIPAGSMVSVSTGWSKASTTVTVKFTGGWNAVLDDLSYGTAASGGTSIVVSSLTASGTGFSVSGLTLPKTIAPGTSASFTVGYAPKAAGASTGSVAIASNAANSKATVALTGSGGSTAVAHSATIAWTSSTSSVSGYNVYRATSAGGTYTKLNAALLTGTSFTDSTVTAGTTYDYAVTSVTSAGVESNYSNVAAVTVPTP